MNSLQSTAFQCFRSIQQTVDIDCDMIQGTEDCREERKAGKSFGGEESRALFILEETRLVAAKPHLVILLGMGPGG